MDFWSPNTMANRLLETIPHPLPVLRRIPVPLFCSVATEVLTAVKNLQFTSRNGARQR
jgi:hypothetical protein